MRPTPTAPPIDLKLVRHELDNGLRVVLHPDARLPLVAVNVWYHVGSKDERPGRTGFAHLFEHMLFQGSENVGTNDHFRYVQQAGGVANGSTWYDRTNYYETLPSRFLELGLWLEADRMGYLLPAMTPEKLEMQREVVLNERRQRVDNQPYGRAMERLHEILYPADHPYHWPVIGYVDDVARATLEEVEAFFRTHYAPGNAVLTLAGDFEPDAALGLVERWFGEIPAGPPPPAPADPPPLPSDAERRETLADDVHLPRVYIAYPMPAYGSPGWHAADLLGTVLAAGKSSLLYQDLIYRRQIAQDVSSFVYPTELDAAMLVIATARPGVDPREVEDAITEHVERAGREELSEARLERARARVLNDFYVAMQKLDTRADLVSQFTTLFDDPAAVTDEPARYAELTAGDLVAIAAENGRRERRAVVTVVPRNGGTPAGGAG